MFRSILIRMALVSTLGIPTLSAVAIPLLSVDIDVLGVINPSSRGVVSVAIFGSDTFDVLDVDPTTLAFGPAGAALAHRSDPHVVDLNRDGLEDLLAHFRTAESGIPIGADEACLTGELVDGTPFQGCDDVRTVPPN